jgi:hypothetical protein
MMRLPAMIVLPRICQLHTYGVNATIRAFLSSLVVSRVGDLHYWVYKVTHELGGPLQCEARPSDFGFRNEGHAGQIGAVTLEKKCTCMWLRLIMHCVSFLTAIIIAHLHLKLVLAAIFVKMSHNYP